MNTDSNLQNETINQLMLKCEGAYAPKTLKSYAADLRGFGAWCWEQGLCWFPADGAVIARYIDEACAAFVMTTVRRKMAAIRFLHVMNDLPSPLDCAAVKLAYRRVMRRNRRQPNRAAPLTQDMLEKLLATCDDSLVGRRDRAILLLGFESLARVAEIVAIRVGDVDCDRLLIPRSKSEIEGRGRFVRLSEEARGAVGDWVAASGLSEGALFRRVRGGYIGESAMDTGSIGRMLRARQGLLEVGSGKLLSGHSFRVGGAQHLMARGHSEIEIMLRGGWQKSEAMVGYLR